VHAHELDGVCALGTLEALVQLGLDQVPNAAELVLALAQRVTAILGVGDADVLYLSASPDDGGVWWQWVAGMSDGGRVQQARLGTVLAAEMDEGASWQLRLMLGTRQPDCGRCDGRRAGRRAGEQYVTVLPLTAE